MYLLELSTQFKKDLKRIQKSNFKDFDLTFEILDILKNKGVAGIPIQMKPHRLKGNYKDNWECHIKPDLLIIWIQVKSPNKIYLIRLGSHSDLFK